MEKSTYTFKTLASMILSAKREISKRHKKTGLVEFYPPSIEINQHTRIILPYSTLTQDGEIIRDYWDIVL